MGRTSEEEAEEQRKNKDLQGDHKKGPARVGHGADEGGTDAGPPPDDAQGGRQQGGSRGR
jgi:hypothetical protein